MNQFIHIASSSHDPTHHFITKWSIHVWIGVRPFGNTRSEVTIQKLLYKCHRDSLGAKWLENFASKTENWTGRGGGGGGGGRGGGKRNLEHGMADWEVLVKGKGSEIPMHVSNIEKNNCPSDTNKYFTAHLQANTFPAIRVSDMQVAHKRVSFFFVVR